MKKYTGSCHCKAVKYSLNCEQIVEATECNCSICEIKGALLTFLPTQNFILEEGGNNLTEYLFAKRTIKYYFCKTCGITTHAQGVEHPTTAVNIRTLSDFDLDKVQRNKFNGKEL